MKKKKKRLKEKKSELPLVKANIIYLLLLLA